MPWTGNALAILLLTGMAVAPGTAGADEIPDAANADTDIRIGNIMPYTGLLAAFATIGKAEAAYFDMVNDKGGINGRKVRFISYDDSSNPATALELARKLVETDKVLLMFGSFGTPSNLAPRRYLNERKIPQLFVASGDNAFANPGAFGWTMGWQPPFRVEDASTRTTSRPSIRNAGLPCCGRTINSGGICSRACRKGLGIRRG
jgi:branched-chain amino acid transport system substrate-binding protein